ncbi:hypothetical protein DDB_G0282423 [Dictyostelium discoideum AX4]|uniref:Ponticulin-like protein D n=1 Tax=Dictyostelium discoideum TaxID=44689 RepID=POND_DICDI|nr:hypothetical protein DDB_G0282423 [Dictyostelium discoideum AX4]Q54SJ8.1 RecName: Full=Ponticulin-like protein D; Flags: Precursor [Dictyostelium discoideum]EAL66071.1 hypothetical protein DDB_G0282423 [Dictyostelium discoideum AX4]|eukprot:XP_640041.1 hypothetical protein DDB_G0282423 [Dictyostelium discoideum AX4]
MLLNKSLLLLVAFVFAIVSATTYSEFKITGTNPLTQETCDPSIVYTSQNGACQGVCGMFGKLVATSNSTQFNVEMYGSAGCVGPLGTTGLTCLPNEQVIKVTETISVVCFADKDEPSGDDSSGDDSSAAATMIASFSAILIALLFALL